MQTQIKHPLTYTHPLTSTHTIHRPSLLFASLFSLSSFSVFFLPLLSLSSFSVFFLCLLSLPSFSVHFPLSMFSVCLVQVRVDTGASASAANVGGSVHWMAPEALDSAKHHSSACDVFSFAMVCYEVLEEKVRPISKCGARACALNYTHARTHTLHYFFSFLLYTLLLFLLSRLLLFLS